MLRFAILCCATMLAFSAQAETAGKAMFPRADSCYARSYSADHLAKHPVQRVTSIALRPQPGSAGDDMLVLRLSVALRGRAETYVGYGYCENLGKGQLACGVEGDGGTFVLTPAEGGAVLLIVGPDGISFEGTDDFQTLEGRTGDDRRFMLQPASGCR